MISKKISKGKTLLSVTSAISLATTTSLAIIGINNNINSSVTTTNKDAPATDFQRNANSNQIKPLVPSQANGQNSFLSTSQGPLVYWNNKITSLDWYGAERWSIDFGDSKYSTVSNYDGAWKRAWFNWDYDRSRNILWVLGYGDKKHQQKLFSIDATNGEVKKTIITGSYGTLKFISALSSGNVLMWDGATNGYNATAKLYNSETDSVSDIKGNSASAMDGIAGKGTDYDGMFRWYFTNTIPIKSGYNLVVLMSFSSKSTQNDEGSKYANYDVYFVLVNDNLDLIANSGAWLKGQLVAQGMQGYRNTTISTQRDYYQLVDGNVATVIYNKIVMINPNDTTADNNVSFSTFTPQENKWILSWSFDTSENLFFKYKDDTKIYKINSANLKTGSNTSVTAGTYYDLSSGNTKMRKYAKNFILYNVFGYQGQIMLVNAWYNDRVDIYDSNIPNVSTDEENKDEYGLVAAITQNLSNPDSGDSKGLLNTSEAFQFSADFSIPQEVLSSKLPSEIVKEDLKITNEGFITQNPNFSTPFIKDMDDSTGKLTVTAYIDQIPWFVTDGKMPKDINPTQITKEYDSLNKISSRISWKNVSADYDFKNTLPSKVTDDDLKRFDPATFNINSQTIADSSGNIVYPKKTYTIENPDDDSGSIKVKAKYDYMPLGVTGTQENAKTVTVDHEYNIFKNSDNKKFVFTGTTDENSGKTIDINTVPQLSSLLENQIFPSTFVSSINQANSEYLQFVNTDLSSGYPTSKMQFSFNPDDEAGTLTITAKLPSGYYPGTANTFTQTYTGLNMNKNYLLNWIDIPKDIKINELLPSEVADSFVFGNFLNYSGFNPLDLNIQLQPDDDSGTLNVTVFLQGQYNDKVKTINGFKKLGNTWVASHVFKNFLTKEQENNQYKLVFKNDNDPSLNTLKKYTTQQVYDALKDNKNGAGLNIDGKVYQNFKDLVSKLLISSTGVSLPKVSDQNVTVSMYFNNGNGTADFVVQYPESVNNLIFVGTFTGFVLGNDIATEDVLSFKTQNALEAEVKSLKSNQPLYNFFNKTVSEAKKWIEQPGNINNLISYVKGQYSALLADNSNYSLTITTNEIYGTISGILQFEKSKIKDSQSVSTFAFSYDGFEISTIS